MEKREENSKAEKLLPPHAICEQTGSIKDNTIENEAINTRRTEK